MSIAEQNAVKIGELLTLREAARALNVHPNTLRNWERAGLLPVVRVGPRRDRRFHRHEIQKFIPPTRAVMIDAKYSPTEAPTVPNEATSNVPIEASSQAYSSVHESPHVIVNVPPKQIFSSPKMWLSVVAVAIIALLVLMAQFGDDGSNSFAIRRNPPQVIFSEDFETYEPGLLPRPTWNTIGMWEVVREDGQRFLRGKQEANNPLNLLSHVYTGSSGWKNYKLKFSARVVSGAPEVTALVNFLDENNFYAITFTESKVSVSLFKDGQKQVLGSAPISFDRPGDWQTFAIDLYGNDMDVLFKGDRVLGIADASLTMGKIGFVAAGQIVDFDHIQVVESTKEIEG